ncbi:MAG: hypothetical protein PHS77_11055 [Gallionellaceae bacterium]|nr:hypothetical protein [Gallionellaceae bacterium]
MADDGIDSAVPEDGIPLLTEVVAEGSAMPGRLAESDIDRLAAALEARLADRLLRPEGQIEAMLRRLVREELDARRD